MRIKEAIAYRIVELCQQHHLTLNGLADLSGMNPSTLYTIVAGRTKNIGLLTFKQICDGLHITMSDFFRTTYFDNRE